MSHELKHDIPLIKAKQLMMATVVFISSVSHYSSGYGSSSRHHIIMSSTGAAPNGTQVSVKYRDIIDGLELPDCTERTNIRVSRSNLMFVPVDLHRHVPLKDLVQGIAGGNSRKTRSTLQKWSVML